MSTVKVIVGFKIFSVRCNISVLCWGLTVKLNTNNHHVSGKCWNSCEGRGLRSRSQLCQKHFSDRVIPINCLFSRVYIGRSSARPVGPTIVPTGREFTLADSLPDRSARRSGVRLHYTTVGQTDRPDNAISVKQPVAPPLDGHLRYLRITRYVIFCICLHAVVCGNNLYALPIYWSIVVQWCSFG